jgi:pSer/pThr/pTyr-binding forkhead associated (FHA) protein
MMSSSPPQPLTDALLEALELDENIELRARADEPLPPSYFLRELDVPEFPGAPPAQPRLTRSAAASAPFVAPAVAEESSEGTIRCPACNAENTRSSKFCGNCGTQLQTALRSDPGSRAHSGSYRVAAPRTATLISINEDGSDGAPIELRHSESVIGRSGDVRFPTDAFLSPKHARITIDDSGVHLEDLYSLNGTYVKLRGELRLTPGDTFLMGRQLLRVEKFDAQVTPKARAGDGTRYMGSPPPTGHYKLIQVGIGGVIQNIYCLNENGAAIGREKGDIIFPRDKFMSGKHAQVAVREDGHYYLSDVGSSNGTWIKIWERRRIESGDFIFLGQQLFRVDL